MKSQRYERAIRLPFIGEEGQRKIQGGSVLLVGSGALGSVAGLYLAGAGVGRIGCVDYDTVEVSNLQRQPAFTEGDVGQYKADTLKRRLSAVNSEIEVLAIRKKINKEDAAELYRDYDIILDTSDSPMTKNMTSEICDLLGKPYCIGGIFRATGQVSTHLPGTASYRDIFPDFAKDGEYIPGSVAGIFGPAPGVVGCIQSAEAIRMLAGETEGLLTNRLLLIDLRDMSFREMKLI